MKKKYVEIFSNKNVSNVHYNDASFKIYVNEEEMQQDSNYHSVQHIHAELEMMLITSGYLYYYVNDEKIRITAGNCIFVNSMQMHSSTLQESPGCQFIVILIHPSIFSDPLIYAKFAKPILENPEIDYLIFDNQTELNSIFHKMVQIQRMQQDTYQLSLLAESYNILKCIYERNTHKTFETTPKLAADISILKKMTTFIYANYNEKITLNDISKCGNISISKCSRMFNQYTKHSPVDFLNIYRLEVASNLLRNSNQSIAYISASCGFEQQSYFNRMFKKEYGVTPSQYRKDPVDQFVH